MKFTDAFGLSTRMFKARKMRTFLTVLGMGVGIGAILFLVSFGYGLQQALLARITTSDSLLTLDVTEANADLVPLDKALVEKIQGLPGVESVSPAFRLVAQGGIGEISLDLVAIGTTPEFLQLSGIRMDEGVPLKNEEPEGILISSTLAQVLEKEAGRLLDKSIDLTFFLTPMAESSQERLEKIGDVKTYQIIGIVPSEENIIYVNAQSLAAAPIEHYSQLKVKCQNSEVMSEVRSQILEQGLVVASLSDTIAQANKIFQIIQFVLMGFGIIALVVSAIGMFNTMTIALMERTEEIGIMKSIGASDWSISVLFIWESAIMGFLGGVGGVVLGLTGGVILNTLINFLAVRLGGTPVDLFYTPTWFILLIVIFAAFVGLLTALVPARRASRVDPLDALRYK